MDEVEELRRSLNEIRGRAELRHTDYAHPCVYALHLLSRNEISMSKACEVISHYIRDNQIDALPPLGVHGEDVPRPLPNANRP
jgi:hypothetical protein